MTFKLLVVLFLSVIGSTAGLRYLSKYSPCKGVLVKDVSGRVTYNIDANLLSRNPTQFG